MFAAYHKVGSMTKKKLTRYGLFKKWFLYYQDYLGLKHWDIKFKLDKEMKWKAECNYSQADGYALIKFNDSMPDWELDNTDKLIKDCAKHECCHLLIAYLHIYATKRYGVTELMIDNELERICNLLEKVI